LDGKVAIIVGSATGIGRATAMDFARSGAKLTLADINPAGEDVAAAVRAEGGEATFHLLDVSDAEAVREVVESTVSTYGGLDILFNNAAALGDEVYGADADVVSVDMAVWDRTFDVNVKGVVYACKYAIPHLITRGGGAIVNTSSVDAIAGQRSKHAYCASKAAVSSLTLDMATAYADHGIRVNAIAPGLVMSPIAVRNLPPEYLEVSARNRLRSEPATPEEIAPLVRFLASDEASFITAQVFVIDGGTLNHQPDFERGMADVVELSRLRIAAQG
jgi:NAD(P)-dependent dehydrogenase (short-subunit alcohol dehydrogenase family)